MRSLLFSAIELDSAAGIERIVCDPAHARVAPLLAYTVLQGPAEVSPRVRERLRGVLQDAAAADAVQTRALSNILAALACANIRALVLKGAAHGHVGYPRPELRPRHDDDLLVAAADVHAAAAALEELGYVRAIEVDGTRVTGQRHYSSRPYGLAHNLDLHARPINPAGFATLPSFDDLWTRRQELPAVGGAVPGRIDAVLLACAHRVAHHPVSDDVLWRLDLHFLASRLDEPDWTRLLELAHATRMARVVASELRRTAELCRTVIPQDLLRQLSDVIGEPSAAYLGASSTIDVEWLNLHDQATLADRVALVTEHLLPTPSYMRALHGPAGPVRLAWLYGRRAIGGGLRWLRERRRNRAPV
jgi:hypothetical protein